MKKITILLLCTIFIVSCKEKQNSATNPVSPNIPTLQNVGNSAFSPTPAYYLNIQVDSNSSPYISYYDQDNDKVYLMKYNATRWETLINGISGINNFNSLAIDPSGNPHISYYSNNRIVVSAYKNGSFSTVTETVPGSILIDNTVNPSISFINNVLYMTFLDKINSSVYVYSKAASSIWNAVGIQPIGGLGSSAYQPSIRFIGSTPYLIYEDADNHYYGIVTKYNGLTWDKISGNYATTLKAQYISSAFSPSGVLYIAYRYNDNNLDIKVNKYNGSIWQEVGSTVSSNREGRYPSLAFLGTSETPYICYTEITDTHAHTGNAILKKFDGSNWVNVIASNIATDARYTSMIASKYGLYIAYSDYNNGGKVTVKKFE